MLSKPPPKGGGSDTSESVKKTNAKIVIVTFNLQRPTYPEINSYYTTFPITYQYPLIPIQLTVQQPLFWRKHF